MHRRIAWLLLLVLLAASRTAVAADEPGGHAASPPQPGSDEEYYELYKLLADTIDQVERNYVQEVDRRELFEAAVRGILGELDPYSAYISPDELSRFRSNVEAEFGGIGVRVGIEDGRLKVISPLVGTPAYRAGMLAGDRIVEIDGQSAEGLSLDDAVKLLKGEAGTPVTLTVVHPGRPGKETLSLVREVIRVETVLGDHRRADDSWEYMIDPEQHIGYVRISAFSRETPRELREALERLRAENLRGLVLDLRFNPGGLLRAAIEVADLFIAKGRIVSTEGRNSPDRVWEATGEGTFEGFPMVVLVNRYSASASEIVAACLQDHRRAVIMGERTWGKGSVQNVIELEHGDSALKLTTAGYLRPSGENIHRFEGAAQDEDWGVMPDEGYALKLGDSEIVGLLRDRRQREVVPPRRPPAQVRSASPDPAASEPSSSQSTAPESAPPDSAAPESAAPSKGRPPETRPGETPTSTWAPAPGDPLDEEPAFIDRQLEMAVEYLSNELARPN